MERKESNLAVIVTIYKVSQYLEKCLTSIRDQTYSRFSVYMIVGKGDCDCEDICKKMADSDHRFRLIVTDPRGLSDARNTGIEMASEPYITFVDGDDYLPTDAFMMLMSLMDEDTDISIGSYDLVSDGKHLPAKKHFASNSMESTEAIYNFLCGHDIQFIVAWGKIYRRTLFAEYSNQYPIGKIHEDNLTTYKLFFHSRRISYTDIVCYHCVERGDSLSYQTNMEKEMCLIEDIPYMRDYLKGIPEIDAYIDAYEISSLILILSKIGKNGMKTEDMQYFDQCLEQLRSVKTSPYVRNRMKVLKLMMSIFPRAMTKLLANI